MQQSQRRQQRVTFEKRHLVDGEHIFYQGDRGENMYIVESGQVRIWTGPATDPNVLGTIGRGGFFGEMALIDRRERTASATAIGPTVLQIVPGQLFRKKMEETDPFIRALLNVLVDNLRYAMRHQKD